MTFTNVFTFCKTAHKHDLVIHWNRLSMFLTNSTTAIPQSPNDHFLTAILRRENSKHVKYVYFTKMVQYDLGGIYYELTTRTKATTLLLQELCLNYRQLTF